LLPVRWVGLPKSTINEIKDKMAAFRQRMAERFRLHAVCLPFDLESFSISLLKAAKQREL